MYRDGIVTKGQVCWHEGRDWQVCCGYLTGVFWLLMTKEQMCLAVAEGRVKV